MFSSFRSIIVVSAANSGSVIRTPGPLSIDARLKKGAASGIA
jgi:hypothetical protein